MSFLKDILSAKSATSSKRLSALFSLVNLLAITWLATIASPGYQTPEFMFDVLAMLVGGGLGLTTLEKIFEKPTTSSTTEDLQ